MPSPRLGTAGEASGEPRPAPAVHFCLVHDDLCDASPEPEDEEQRRQWFPMLEIMWHFSRGGGDDDVATGCTHDVSVSALIGSTAVHMVAAPPAAAHASTLHDFQEGLWAGRAKGIGGTSWVERPRAGASRQALLDNVDFMLRDAPEGAPVLVFCYEPHAHSGLSSPYSQLVALGRQRSLLFPAKVYVVLAAKEHNPAACNALLSNIADHLAPRFRVMHVDLLGRDAPPGLRLPLHLLAKYLKEQWSCGNLSLAAAALSSIASADGEGRRSLPKPRWQCIRSRSPRQTPAGAQDQAAAPVGQCARTCQPLPRARSPSGSSEARGRPRRSAASEERRPEAGSSHRVAHYGLRLSSKCSRAVFYGSIDSHQPLVATCPCCSSSIQVALERAAGPPPMASSSSCAAGTEGLDLGQLRGSHIILSSARAARKTFRAAVEEPACSSFCPLCRRPLTITFGQAYKERLTGVGSTPPAVS